MKLKGRDSGMKVTNFESDETLRRYLLGQLAEEGRERIEEQVMTNPGFEQRLHELEDELVDDYAAGALDPAAKQGFERLFLADPSRKRQVDFARALRQYVDAASTGRAKPVSASAIRIFNFWPARALAAACLLMAIAGGGLFFRMNRLQVQLNEMNARQSASSQEPKAVAAQNNPIALTLLPGRLRDSGPLQRIPLPKEQQLVQLKLILEHDEYSSYEAALLNAEEQVWSQKGFRAVPDQEGKSVVIQLQILEPQDYKLKLSGLTSDGKSEPVATYYFRVSAK
jgi:hypothetical protein